MEYRETFLADGTTEPRGSFYPLLAAGVFAYFAFEAFLNEALRQVKPDVWEKEAEVFSKGPHRRTLGKFDYLASLCGHSTDKSRRPFQTVRELASARDFLVHAKTELFDTRASAEDVAAVFRRPSVLDRYASLDFSTRALEDVEAVCDSLLAALTAKFGDTGIGSKRGVFSGIVGSYHATLVEPTR